MTNTEERLINALSGRNVIEADHLAATVLGTCVGRDGLPDDNAKKQLNNLVNRVRKK